MNITQAEFTVLPAASRRDYLMGCVHTILHMDPTPELQYAIYLDLCGLQQRLQAYLLAVGQQEERVEPQHIRQTQQSPVILTPAPRQQESREYIPTPRPPYQQRDYNAQRGEYKPREYTSQSAREYAPRYNNPEYAPRQYNNPEYAPRQQHSGYPPKGPDRQQSPKPYQQKERKEDKYKRLAAERALKRELKAKEPRPVVKPCACGGDIYNKKFDICGACHKRETAIPKPTDEELASKCMVHFEPLINGECLTCKQKC